MEPFYDMCSDYPIRQMVTAGHMAPVDEKWRRRSLEEARLADLLPEMWAMDPADRPDIHQVIARLEEILAQARHLDEHQQKHNSMWA